MLVGDVKGLVKVIILLTVSILNSQDSAGLTFPFGDGGWDGVCARLICSVIILVSEYVCDVMLLHLLVAGQM